MADEIYSDPAALQAQAFQEGMQNTAPRVFVTPVLIAINVAVFIAMAVNGVSIMDPTIDALIKWGADFGPLTTHGQWWRLLTAAFVHIGIIHILMNMYILFMIGMFVERLFGNLGFTVLYLLAGIGGNLVSVAWHPMTVAAGASGAVFGVYGGLMGFLLLQRSAIPSGRVAPMFKSAAIFLGYNLIYGAAKSNVDMSAHLGGFATGFLVGCALAQPLTTSQAARMARNLVVLVVGLAISALCATRIPVSDDLSSEMKHFDAVETASIKLFNDSLDSVKADKMSAADFDNVVQKKILPPWNGEKSTLSKLRLVDKQKQVADQLIQYMSVRAEGWSMIAQGIVKNDSDIIKQANAKQKEAETIASSIK